jgi:predicted deacylase
MSETLEEICQIELPTGEEVGVVRRRFTGGPGPHVAIVAAVRGDTPEGTRVAHAVARHLRLNHDRLTGTVDVYPCVNPLAAHHGARNWPGFDLDLNRRFPGRADGHAPDRVAYALTQSLRPVDQVIELRGAHPAFREETQAHVRADQALALERAVHANVRLVWKRGGDIEGTGTLASQVPGMICLEGGRGNRLTEGVGNELCDGVLNLLVVLKVLPEDNLPFHWAAIQRPALATDDDVVRVRATRGGLFLPQSKAWTEVAEGDVLGEVVDPIGGEAREAVVAPAAGRVLAVGEQPVVYPGSLVARIVRLPE